MSLRILLITIILSFCPIISLLAITNDYFPNDLNYLTSNDIVWDLSKRIIADSIPVIEGRRFSYSGENDVRKDRIVIDEKYVILDVKITPNVGMYEVRRDNASPFHTQQGYYMACFNKQDSIVEVINVPCGRGSKMKAIPITEPMIEKKGIEYVKFSIPREGNVSYSIITNWGQYTIKDEQKREMYASLFVDGINTKYFKRALDETDDSPLLQAAMNLAYWGKTVQIAPTFYSLSKPLEVFYMQDVQMHANTTLYAKQGFDGTEYSNSVVEIDCGAARIQVYNGADRYTMWLTYPEQNRGLIAVERHGIRGGCIDGNGIANCIKVSHARGMVVDELSLKNPKNRGLFVSGSQEMFISRCTCINTIESKEVNTAFHIASPDNMIRDCVSIDTNVGFNLQHYTIASSLHHWIGMIDGKYEGSVSFIIYPEGCTLTGCYADTSETGYYIKSGPGECNLIGCIALTNPKMVNINRTTGIKAEGKVNVIGGSFNLKCSNGTDVTLFENPENIKMINYYDKY